jgi:hypothetical protein
MKALRILFGIGLVLGSAYFLLGKENLSSYSFPDLEKKEPLSANFLNQLTRYSSENISTGVAKIASTVSEKSSEIFQGIADKAKLETFKIFKKSVNDKVNDLGESIGVSIGAVGDDGQITFGVRAGTPIYFSLEARSGDSEYEVDWRDGKKDIGTFNDGESIALSHAWTESGDYSVKFSIINSKGKKNYQIPINIK